MQTLYSPSPGPVRGVVRELLERHPLVTRFEPAERAEGGEGVTVAYLESV